MAQQTSVNTKNWTGPAYPFRKGVMGALGPKSDDEVLATSIQNILLTSKGEWRCDPTVGSFLWSLVMEPLDVVTQQLIMYYTAKDLYEQETRIQVVGVTVVGTGDHLVTVQIAFVRKSDPAKRILSTAIVFNKAEAA